MDLIRAWRGLGRWVRPGGDLTHERDLLAAVRRLTAGARGDYVFALVTGYGAVAIHGGSQLILVPLYLGVLGKYQFGVLMIVFGLVNFGGAGAWWITGGMQRILGECDARGDRTAFAKSFSVLRAAYFAYAALLGLAVFAVLRVAGESWLSGAPPDGRTTILRGLELCALHFIAHYDLSAERLALTAAGRQAAANALYGVSVIVYVVLVVPWLLSGGQLDGVVVCLMAGTVAASVASRVYRRRIGVHVASVRLDAGSLAILRRLGRLGLPYLGYGLVLLGMGADVLVVGWLGSAVLAAEFALVWKPAEILTQTIWKIPEYFIPHLIRMDARQERRRLAQVSRQGWRGIAVLSLAGAAAYAALGPDLVRWWVGADAPEGRLPFLLAGAAVFWLSVARLPGVIAYSTARLEPFLRIAAVELVAKLLLTIVLFPYAGYLAPLIAVSAVHLLGIWAAYRRQVLAVGAEAARPAVQSARDRRSAGVAPTVE